MSALGRQVVSRMQDLVNADTDEEIQEAHDESFEEIGKSFTVSCSKLSAAEAAALEIYGHRGRDPDEAEAEPLPPVQRDAGHAPIVQPYKTHALQPPAEALCIAASQSSTLLAVAGRQGRVQLFNSQSLEPMDALDLSSSAGAPAAAAALHSGHGAQGPAAITALRFRDEAPGSQLQNVILAAQGDAVLHVHAGTRKVLSSVHEPGNNINALAVQDGGQLFATGGSDAVVRVYGEARCEVVSTLDHGDGASCHGHANHIFSVVWNAQDPQVLLSSGWDHTVQVWDLRAQRSVRQISGPYICGDALDVSGGRVLTGSWRQRNALQLWDYGSGRLLTNLPWPERDADACLIYAAKFGRGGLAGTVVAGGSGAKPAVRIYSLVGPGNVTVSQTAFFQRPVHALDLLPAAVGGGGEALAVCCDQEVHLLKL